MQTRVGSLAEAFVNVAVGYGVALGTQAAVFPLFGIKVDTKTHALIGIIFTFVSLVRSYFLRRLFNSFGRAE